MAGPGLAGHGEARQARRGRARLGEARQGGRGMAWQAWNYRKED